MKSLKISTGCSRAENTERQQQDGIEVGADSYLGIRVQERIAVCFTKHLCSQRLIHP